MKKNRKIQIWFVALATMLFTASCEKDEIIVETFEGNNPKVKEVTFKELSSDVKFVNAFSKISKNHQINNSLGRTVMENQYNFTIDDYPAKVIELDSLTSYTFSINNQTRTNSVFENLVINHYTNGITKAAIIKYTPNQNNILNDSIVNEHNSKHFEGTTEIIPIIYNANNINQRQTTICFTSNVLLCNYGGREHPAGERCGTTYWGTQTTCETIFTAPDYYTSIVQIIEDTGNNNGGATSVSVGMALADNFANTQLTPEQKLIYDSNPSIREYLANNVIIVPVPNYNPLIGGDPTMAAIDPEAQNKVNNFINLLLELEENPNTLIEIPCDQLPQWMQIAQYNLPQSVLNKISNLQNQNSGAVPNWDIQTLFGAGGAVVNMDFFPVTISQFPNNPNTNQPYSPQEFYDFFRLNLNLFTQSSGVSFYPSNITGLNESSIWNSNNPLNAVLSINMQPDSGSVICSNYSANKWYFTTLTTPWAFSWSQDDYDGFHPVSGNREFGYYNDINGNSVFYVRGVDRIERGAVFTIADNTPWWDSPFSAADEKWNAMQENLKNYIETNGGVAVINTDNIYRPNWNDIKDVLSGVKPLSDLGCD